MLKAKVRRNARGNNTFNLVPLLQPSTFSPHRGVSYFAAGGGATIALPASSHRPSVRTKVFM